MMPYAEFIEQIAYYQLFPWGDDWLQSGVVASAAANSHPYRRRPAKPEQFMPKVHKPRQTVEQQTNVFMGMIEAARKAGRLIEVKSVTVHQ